MSVKATLAKVSSHTVSTESMPTHATVPMDLEANTVNQTSPLAQRKHATIAEPVETFLTLDIIVSAMPDTKGPTVKRTSTNASLHPVKMAPSVKMASMPTSVSVCLDFRASTVTWT